MYVWEKCGIFQMRFHPVSKEAQLFNERRSMEKNGIFQRRPHPVSSGTVLRF